MKLLQSREDVWSLMGREPHGLPAEGRHWVLESHRAGSLGNGFLNNMLGNIFKEDVSGSVDSQSKHPDVILSGN